MLATYIIFFFLSFTNCQYFTKDEVEIILSIAKNQFIKHLIITMEKPKNVIEFGILKLINEKYFLTILDFSYLEDYIKHIPVTFYKSVIIIKDISKMKLSEDKISSYTWIIFDNQEKRNSKVLRNVYIPYNALILLITKVNGTYYEITEIYNTDYKKMKHYSKVFESKIQLRNVFGTWTRDKKLSVGVSEFYRRRLNLRGSPFTVTGQSPFRNPFRATSMYELWKDLHRVMNFTYVWLNEIYVVENHVYTDAWIRLVPVTSSGFFPYNVGPIFTNKIYMHIKDDFNDDYDWASIFKPFSLKIWIYLIIWLIIPGTVLVIYEQRKKEENKDIFGASMAPFDILCSQWALDDQKTLSWRITIFFILTTGMIFLNSYTAVFTSFLTIPNPQLPFTDLEGFSKDGSYVIGSTNFHMKEHVQAMIAEITKTNAKNYIHTPEEKEFTVRAAIHRLCSNRKFVLLLENNVGMISQKFFGLCKIFKIPKPIMEEYLYFGMRDLSPYKEIFTIFFMSARSNGVLKKLDKTMEQNLGMIMTSQNDSEEFDFTATMSQLMTVVRIIFFGWLVSLIVFIMEFVSKAIFTAKKIN